MLRAGRPSSTSQTAIPADVPFQSSSSISTMSSMTPILGSRSPDPSQPASREVPSFRSVEGGYLPTTLTGCYDCMMGPAQGVEEFSDGVIADAAPRRYLRREDIQFGSVETLGMVTKIKLLPHCPLTLAS